MKKLSLVLFMIILTMSFVVAEGTFEAIVHPTAGDLSDDFGNGTTYIVESDWYQYNYDDAYIYRYNENREDVISQGYDYNVGDLKGDKYHFTFRLYSDGSWGKSGIQINDINTSHIDFGFALYNTYRTGSRHNRRYYNQFEYYVNGTRHTFDIENSDIYFTYDFLLTRKDNNTFDIVIEIQDYYGNGIHSFEVENVVLNTIYPSLWVERNKSAYYYDFDASYVKSTMYGAIFTSLYQDGEELYFEYGITEDHIIDVKLIYSEDTTFDTTGVTDQIIDLPSSKKITVTDDMKVGGYLGIFGKSNGSPTLVDYKEIKYLNEPQNFYYVPTGTTGEFKFRWDAVEHATGYKLVYGSGTSEKVIYPDALTATNTQFTITDPTKMSIVAKSPSPGGVGDSVSISVNAEEGPLDPVTNLNGTIVKRTVEEDGEDVDKYFVDLSWNEYAGATEYTIVRNTTGDQYPVLAVVNDAIEYSDPLTSQFLRINYKIKTKIGEKVSPYSDVLTIENKVKDVFYNFDDVNELVKLYWEPIDEAMGYKVFTSINPDMSDETSVRFDVTSDENAADFIEHSFAFDKDDTQNRYIQVQAYHKNDSGDIDIESARTNILTLDYTRNNMVRDFKADYKANSNQVTLSWSALENANSYALYIGDSPTSLEMHEIVSSLNYLYRLGADDGSSLYFAIQGLHTNGSFVLSNPIVVETFTKDFVQNLSSKFDESTSSAKLRWNTQNRADGYVIYKNDVAVNTTPITSNNYVLTGAAEGDKVYVKAVMNYDSKTYYTLPSNITTLVASDSDIAIDTEEYIAEKHYGSPLEFNVEFDINRDASRLYDVSAQFVLTNDMQVNNGVRELLASYIYPEIVSVKIVDLDGVSYDMPYTLSIESGMMIEGQMVGDAGYVMTVELPDTNTRYLQKGTKLSIRLKTDFRFTDIVFSDLKTLGRNYPLMELPFYIENAESALNGAAIVKEGTLIRQYDANFLDDSTFVDATLSYNLTDNDFNNRVTNSEIIDFGFKNKRLIIGE